MIGVYPLLKNGTCRFFVFDFDNHEKGAEKKDFSNTNEAWMEEVKIKEWAALGGWMDSFGRGVRVFLLFLALVGICWIAVFILGIMNINIIKSFKIHKSGDAAGCINGMLIHAWVYFLLSILSLCFCFILR